MRLPYLLLFVLLTSVAVAAEEANYKLVLEDNFDGGKLNAELWDVKSGAKQRGSLTDEAVSIKDGVLTITTWSDTKVDFTGSIKMKKAKYFDFRRGKVEGRLRFNPTQGVTVFFGNDTDEEAKQQPQVNIDVFTSFGYEKGATYMSGVSWKDPSKSADKKEVEQRNTASVGKYWHTYGVEWDDAGYRFTMDGKVRMNVKNPEGIASQRGIELGCALPAGEHAAPKGGYGPKGKSKATYEIDWVKAWKYVEPPK